MACEYGIDTITGVIYPRRLLPLWAYKSSSAHEFGLTASLL